MTEGGSTLAREGEQAREPPPPLIRMAVACAVVPMALGILLVLAAALSTDPGFDEAFAVLGLLLLPIGAAFDVVGLVLVVCSWFVRPVGTPAHASRGPSAFAVLALLLAAWPVAWACMWLGTLALDVEPIAFD